MIIINEHNDTNHYHITTTEFNRFTVEMFDLRVKLANLTSKSDIANFVKQTGFDNKLKDVRWNKNKLNELLKKLKAIFTKGYLIFGV